jgi:hypothetical protein
VSFFASFSKSLKLRSISKELAAPLVDEGFSIESMMEGSHRREQALERLLDLCDSTPNLRAIIKAYGSDRDGLKRVYRALLLSGAGQWVSGHYVAASAVAFPATLDYTLRKFEREKVTGRDDLDRVAFRLLQYFERGEVGPVAD